MAPDLNSVNLFAMSILFIHADQILVHTVLYRTYDFGKQGNFRTIFDTAVRACQSHGDMLDLLSRSDFCFGPTCQPSESSVPGNLARLA